MRFAGRFEPKGFPNDAFNNDVAFNGSFMNSQYVPSFGYQEGNELGDDDIRQRNGLKPKPRMKNDRRSGGSTQQLSHPATPTGSRSTKRRARAPDQISIAPGYLEREWTENGRRCFHYAMDRPILDFYATLSARYAVERTEHNGVKLEIYYHPGARVRAAVDAAGVEGRTRLLRHELLAVSVPPVSHHRVPAVSGLRAGVSRTRFPTPRASASCIARKRATTRSTLRTSSRRTSSRTSGGRTRSSAATARGRRCSPKASPSTRRSR